MPIVCSARREECKGDTAQDEQSSIVTQYQIIAHDTPFMHISPMRTWVGTCALVLAATPAAAQQPVVIQKANVRLEPAIPGPVGPPEVFGRCPFERVAPWLTPP